jgi:hypothetical protein
MAGENFFAVHFIDARSGEENQGLFPLAVACRAAGRCQFCVPVVHVSSMLRDVRSSLCNAKSVV